MLLDDCDKPGQPAACKPAQQPLYTVQKCGEGRFPNVMRVIRSSIVSSIPFNSAFILLNEKLLSLSARILKGKPFATFGW